MARYGREMERSTWNRTYDVGYRANARSRNQEVGGYERGLEIGPTWGGGSDIGYRTYPVRGARSSRGGEGRVPRGYDAGSYGQARGYRSGGYEGRPLPRGADLGYSRGRAWIW